MSEQQLGANAWSSMLSKAFFTLQVGANPATRFRPTLKHLARAGVSVAEITVDAGPHTVCRPAAGAQDAPGSVIVSVQLSGVCVVQQDEREAVLRPGDFAIYDPHRQYQLVFPTASHAQAVVHFIDPGLGAEVSQHLTAVRVSGRSPIGGIVGPMLAGLPQVIASTDPWSARRLVLSGVDLLATALGTHAALLDSVEEERGRVLRYLELRSDDPSLRPSTIAGQLHISTSHLHRLFRNSGTTVMNRLFELRLTRAAEDLSNPTLNHRRISDIAYDRGFKDPAHFTRSFTRRFGVTPSQWRQQGGSVR